MKKSLKTFVASRLEWRKEKTPFSVTVRADICAHSSRTAKQ
jgi:hypothetical protein